MQSKLIGKTMTLYSYKIMNGEYAIQSDATLLVEARVMSYMTNRITSGHTHSTLILTMLFSAIPVI